MVNFCPARTNDNRFWPFCVPLGPVMLQERLKEENAAAVLQGEPRLHAGTTTVGGFYYNGGSAISAHNSIAHRETCLCWRSIWQELRNYDTDFCHTFLEVGVLF